ncbi:MAG TPA: biopolymer transporter ExbD [Woeseiaceae bacterium]|nr:biopolymer transporter ExbD [Woeseiaceae bacterium]
MDAREFDDRTCEMRAKYKNILWLATMLLGVFLAVNWIYGRTQLSGWMPLPLSIMILVGATYQSFELIGKLLEPSRILARQVAITLILMSVVVTASALVIFNLTKPLDVGSVNADGPTVPAEEISASTDLVIEVSINTYSFRADGGAVVDLDSLIARCQELITRSPDRQVVIFAESDVPYTQIIEVTSALRDAGISDIKFSTGTN